jgi:hypothetical protein
MIMLPVASFCRQRLAHGSKAVQVDVGEQRRDHRPLPRPPVTDRHGLVFVYSRPQPFLDQADDAPIANSVFHEADQPFLVDRIEERLDVGVQYPVHLGAGDPDRQRVQRIMLATSRPKPITRTRGSLPRGSRSAPWRSRPGNLVLQGGNRQWPLSAIRLRRPVRRDGCGRYAPRWTRPCRSASLGSRSAS